MAYLINHLLLGTLATSLFLTTLDLNGMNQEPTLKRNKNFDIKHSDENPLNDVIEAAHFEKNYVLGFFLYDEGWDGDSMKNMAKEFVKNNVPPQNAFAIMQTYINCIEDEKQRPIIFSSFINWVLRQAVIDGNEEYATYCLTAPVCKKFIMPITAA
jgi:hypothetical protein